jgi:apolipoprotein N-acyltransferase
VSLSPLIVSATIVMARGGSLWRVFRLGALTGIVYFAGTLYWLADVMATHGGLPLVAGAALALLLAAYLSIFVGAFAWLVGLAVRRFGLTGLWLAPVFWVATEWLRAWLGAAFPWVLLGSSQTNVPPVVQLASVTGVYGLSGLIAMVATAASAIALRRNRATLLGSLAVLLTVAAVVTWGSWRLSRSPLTSTGTPIRVGLLQGNIEQHVKWNAAFRDAIMDRYVTLSRQALSAGASLVIWPEAATPFYFDLAAPLAEPIRRLAREARTPFLIGTDQYERGENGVADRYYNAAVLVGTDGATKASYRKVRLVPFGEYVPFKRLLFFVGPLVEAVSDFSAGDTLTVFDAEGARFSVAICYEAIYAEMAREFVGRGAELLTTITNDAWFGRSSAAYQHFDQAALRAVEQGRYLVRAANTGFSGAVDPYGRVLVKTQLFETTSVVADVRLLQSRTIYGRTGNLLAHIALVVTALFVVAARRSARRAASHA